MADELCQQKGLACYDVVAKDTWELLWPDAVQRDLIKRLNRINLKLKAGMRIAYPFVQEGQPFPTLLDLSPLPLEIEPMGEKQVIVDLSQLAWGAYDSQGALVYWGPVAAGKKWCPDVGRSCQTPPGEYSVLRKGNAKCRSKKFPIPKGGAPMPYCMFFKGGYALHGSYDVPGYHASHGCVRMFPEDAKWLNEEFVETPKKENEFRGTKVWIRPYFGWVPGTQLL